MATQAKRRMAPEEYLRIERHSDVKHEFLNGEMFALSGASPTHVINVRDVYEKVDLASAAAARGR